MEEEEKEKPVVDRVCGTCGFVGMPSQTRKCGDCRAFYERDYGRRYQNKPCSKGHVNRNSFGKCRTCFSDARKARLVNKKQHIDNLPCPKGHVGNRNSSGNCLTCRAEWKNCRMGANCETCGENDWTQNGNCRKCISKRGKESKINHPDRYFRRKLCDLGLHSDSLSFTEYEAMKAEQNNCCAICNSPETTILNGKPAELSIDHCHKTMKIRGLLCGKHNRGIGSAGDSPLTLRALANYLEAPPAWDTCEKNTLDCPHTDRTWTQKWRRKYTSVYDNLLREQNHCCAACRSAETAHNNQGNIAPLSVDHCHQTGRVRGLLCARCNRAIGMFQDSIIHLRAAADYLDKWATIHALESGDSNF